MVTIWLTGLDMVNWLVMINIGYYWLDMVSNSWVLMVSILVVGNNQTYAATSWLQLQKYGCSN